VRIVRGRADARWLPSRHNIALFRLAAWWKLRRTKPEMRDMILVIDRHQSATETWVVMSWVVLTTACYLAATLFASWPAPLGIAVGVPIAIAGLEVPAILSALTVGPLWRAVTRPERLDSIDVNGAVVMLLFTAASAYFAARPSWIRFVGWQFLVLLALNAVAAAIVFLLRDSIARLEAAVVGGGTSGQ
jgi:hypothetical protein